jgi:hypothetical protein
MKLKYYRVYGEWGPQADSYFEKKYLAQNPQNARIMFEEWMKRTDPWLWENRMGSRNVHVEEQIG